VRRFECPRCQTAFPSDRGDDDAFVECPSCGALAMASGEGTGVDEGALARNLSSAHDVASLRRGLETTVEGDSADDGSDAAVDRSEASRSGEGRGIFHGLLGVDPPPVATSPPTPGAPARANAGLDLGLDDDFSGDFNVPVSRPAPPTSRSSSSSPPPKRTATTDPPAAEAPPTLGDDALGALEAAFDTLALAPTAARGGSDGLTDDERRFLHNVMGAAPPPPPPRPAKVEKPPPRPPEKPGVPRPAPPPLKRKSTSAGFLLSAETREAAFLALKGLRGQAAVELPSAGAQDREVTVPTSDDAPASGRTSGAASVQAGPLVDFAADPVLASTRAPRPRPTVWRDVHKGALAAAIVLGVLVGTGVGAAVAPAKTQRNDARARAELALADGNRYYEVARYDDALGKFKNAINNDRTYAPAHRAKGAALAKQAMMAAQTQQGEQAQRLWDEAAAAYREYLALEPSAIDAADIKDALARRGVSPVSTGRSDG
jgi:hypothetical protein